MAAPRRSFAASSSARFGGFTVTRIVHSLVYVAGKQPWRTLFFIFGALFTVALMVQVVRAALAHLT